MDHRLKAIKLLENNIGKRLSGPGIIMIIIRTLVVSLYPHLLLFHLMQVKSLFLLNILKCL